MKNLDCAICGKKQKLIEFYPQKLDIKKISGKTFSARRIPDRMHYRFVKCLNCELIFSNPILEENKIYNLYEKSGFHYDKEIKYLQKTYGGYLKYVVKDKKNLSLLDIGCGNGFFLEEAKRLGINKIFGIEPGKSTVFSAPFWLKPKIKLGFFKNDAYPKSSFDIVTCFHALDHIINPALFLKNVLRVLKKNGIAFFIVHDTDGLSVKIFGEKSPIFDIEHIYLFNKKNLEKIFLENGFKRCIVLDIKNIYPINYWVMMSPLPKSIKSLLIDFLKFSKLNNLPLSLKAGNIGIFAFKEKEFNRV